jgi:hypothetical protein
MALLFVGALVDMQNNSGAHYVLSHHRRIRRIPSTASALIPTAFQELIHSFIHCCNWPDNRLRSLKILALQRKTRTIRRPCGLTAGILIYKNLND